MDIKTSAERVIAKVSSCCERAGRQPGSLKLVAVSKTFSHEHIRQAYAAGIRDFGENYMGEALPKMEQLKDLDIRWHFVGRLQSRKIGFINRFELFHSADSIKTLAGIEKKADRAINVLIQVNIGDEMTKAGIGRQRIVEFIGDYLSAGLTKSRLCGIMVIPPPPDVPEDSRQYFRQARELFLSVKERFGAELPYFSELSMGMSDDYEVAIEEGATILRIGRAIFGGRH